MAKHYKCPYCNFSSERDKLIDHIDEDHDDLVPEGYTPTRVVFNIVNKREFGVCMVCKGKTEWNEKAGKYNKICEKESCRKQAREAFTKNMIKVYNKPTLLDDEDWQAHMLANRKISGKYKFSDGGSVTYTGTYEKKCLEFMDTVLNISSKDVMCPGPTFEYEYLGETHKWITDIYYVPANLVIEIKDGGSNPNNRSMVSYREKQIEKEKMITNLGTYNYIRLTDNQFVQLIDILAELKERAMDGEVSPVSRVHEAMGIAAIGGITGVAEGDIYVGLYKSNSFVDSKDYDKMCITKGMFDNDTLGIEDGILTNIALDENTSVALFKFVGDRNNYKKLLERYNHECSENDIYEILSGKAMLSKDQIAYDKDFEFMDFTMPIIDVGGEL